MKIAVVGCGAVGSYYGALLRRAGDDVHFLLRSDYESVSRNGVQILSRDGGFRVNPTCARDPHVIGPCDLILIALKTTANHEFRRLLPPLVGPQTVLLTLQNGLGNEEDLAALFGAENVMGALCFVCLNRLEPGVIQHMAHGHIHLGEFQRPPIERTHEVARLFRRAGVPVTVADRLDLAHWEKLIWNIPFNGLSVASAAGSNALKLGCWDTAQRFNCLSTDRLLDDPQWIETLRFLMREVISIARGLGFQLNDELVEDQIARTREMGVYRPSTLIDFELGRDIELRSLFERPLVEARRLGLSTPWLERLCVVLRQLADHNNVNVGQTASCDATTGLR